MLDNGRWTRWVRIWKIDFVSLTLVRSQFYPSHFIKKNTISNMKHNFKELTIWKNGIELAVCTYYHCKQLPKEELFGLAAQMKRAAVSIPSNIAEGCGRGSDAQVIHFLDISLGSSFELETQVVIANRLDFIDDGATMEWIRTIHQEQKQIRSFRDKLASGR